MAANTTNIFDAFNNKRDQLEDKFKNDLKEKIVENNKGIKKYLTKLNDHVNNLTEEIIKIIENDDCILIDKDTIEFERVDGSPIDITLDNIEYTRKRILDVLEMNNKLYEQLRTFNLDTLDEEDEEFLNNRIIESDISDFTGVHVKVDVVDIRDKDNDRALSVEWTTVKITVTDLG